ncbi:MAG: hypothetical protein IT307_17830 [Chloroflexi bacterium]|nr:hypothetical protein [Chloroflexota bacterium]
MPRFQHLPELRRKEMLTLPYATNEEDPRTPLSRALRQARVALVTSAGLHVRGDKPFVTDHRDPDQSYRVLPSDTPAAEVFQSHTSIGFDRAGIQQALNVTYPVDRPGELEERRVIGSLAGACCSCTGALRKWQRPERETAPEAERSSAVFGRPGAWEARRRNGSALRPGTGVQPAPRPSRRVLEAFPEAIVPPDAPKNLVVERPADPAFELTGLRAYDDQFVEAHGGRTAAGLAGVLSTRRRGLVRLLERYANGEEVDAPERNPGTPVLQYIRNAADDVKPSYREARLQQRPTADGAAIDAWSWYETAMGGLIMRVRDRMKESGDAYANAVAHGISRV